MPYSKLCRWLLVLSYFVVVICESYYSVIAPGVIKSNHKYNVLVSLHEALEPAGIRVSIEGPSYQASHLAFVQPLTTMNVEFEPTKLKRGTYMLKAEGISGIKFQNESRINEYGDAGPKIYIQTDKGIYKPGDEVLFRVVLLNEHTRPLRVREPIRVEILDGKDNRVKQFKDIAFVRGIFTGKFQLSEYPVMGNWQIRVFISGRYDFSKSKGIRVQRYVLPKFSVYIKMDKNILPDDRVIPVLVYGKYTFDKYVEGNVTATLKDHYTGTLLQEKVLYIKDQLMLEFRFDKPLDRTKYYNVVLKVLLTEKQTGLTQSEEVFIPLRNQRYHIYVDTDTIKFQGNRPYRLKATVQHWNGTNVADRITAVKMTHGSKEYQAYLDDTGKATFDFDHDPVADHVFRYKDSTFRMPNIYAAESTSKNITESYCKLKLKGDRPRLGAPIEIEVTSIANIPYLVYAVVGHANFINWYNVKLPPNRKSYTIRIKPSIEMIPLAYVYVHYVLNGNFYYEELELKFPMEFENKVSVLAPKQVGPGQKVTLDLRAQPGAHVGILAVDLGVYLLDPSYDLQRQQIMSDLLKDVTRLPFPALVYPGLVSGVVTFTNAHYEYVPLSGTGAVAPTSAGVPKFRIKFPETWIFENYDITSESTKLTLDIPDTITTWRITAFSVHDTTGFGIIDGPTDITTIQSFFINLNLPYSVKRGEIVAIPVIIYNYHSRNLDTEVTLYNDNKEFFYMASNIFAGFRVTHDNNRMIRIVVPANGVESVKFYINPKQVGNITLRIVAQNPVATDAIIQQLKVEPEGTIKRHNKAVDISLQPNKPYKVTLSIDMPQEIVPLSEFISLSVSGDTLVPTLQNLNDLVLLPTGCGEQNMVNFAPNILVLQYLKASGNYLKEKEVVSKAKKFIEIGYQQQLSYRHSNGGYSVFGPRSDSEASTWLTAYVVRFFIKSTRYLAIENHIIDSGLEYLSQNQLADGSFRYTGYLFYPAHQNRYGFTAFVLMTYLEQKKYATKYQATIEKGLQFLNNNLNQIDDLYALSIMATALQRAKHQNAAKVLDKLMMQKQRKAETVWWTQSDRNLEKDVEITAYVLMALLDSNGRDAAENQRIHKWLTEQRNERGGFKSTHDTVVGLQALVKFAEKYSNDVGNKNMKIHYSAKDKPVNKVLKSGTLTVDANNALILQTEEFPKSTRSIEIEATGLGHSLLQLSYHYYMFNDDNFKHFHIQTTPSMPNPEELLLDICFTYRQPNLPTQDTTTNMIIMEVNLPSGFTSSDEFSNELLDNDIVERIESQNSETTLVVYFEKLTANVRHCLNILASKLHEVAMRKPAAIAIYDYYNISRHDTVFYSV